MSFPSQFQLYSLLLAAALGSAFAPNEAQAVSRQRLFIQNAIGPCQPSLAAFENQIRNRPLALQNEGTSPVFISCSFTGTDRAANGFDVIVLIFDNNTSSTVNVTCSLVTGLSKFGTQQALPKTIVMQPNSGGFQNQMFWTPGDNGGQPFDNFSLNADCTLPAGTGISQTVTRYDEDVGA
ncbi:MAG: hypothetical protein ABJA62_08135 [Luteimonas sp.]